MAHVWHKNMQTEQWTPIALTAEAYHLSGGGLSLLEGVSAEEAISPLAIRICRPDASVERWVLMTDQGTGVIVNGRKLPLGIRVLRERDELVVNDSKRPRPARFFFSMERPIQSERFVGCNEQPIHCPRCRQPIEQNQMVVCCSQCGTWHHQIEDELPCWTYSSTCAMCDRPTELTADYRWTPEGL